MNEVKNPRKRNCGKNRIFANVLKNGTDEITPYREKKFSKNKFAKKFTCKHCSFFCHSKYDWEIHCNKLHQNKKNFKGVQIYAEQKLIVCTRIAITALRLHLGCANAHNCFGPTLWR